MKVFMQLVCKCGWAVKVVQDRLDELYAHDPPGGEQGQARANWEETNFFLQTLKASIRATLFSPEEWFMAIHFAFDGKTTATTTPAGIRNLQDPMRIPARNNQPTVLGGAGVLFSSSTVPREYVYNMRHELGYLPDSAAAVLDPGTRYVPLVFPARAKPTPTEPRTNLMIIIACSCISTERDPYNNRGRQ